MVITYKCNLHCPICFLRGESRNKSPIPYYFQTEEANLKIWQKFIKEVAHFSPAIILTGGEPLLSSIWDKVAEEIKKEDLTLCLLTNGIKIDENLDKIIKLADYIQVSLDGPEAEIHNYFRLPVGDERPLGKDIFEKVVSNLILLDKKKKSLSSCKPYLNIGYTIHQKNFNQLINTLKFLSSLDISICEVVFLHLLFTRASLKNSHQDILKKRGNPYFSSFWEGFFYPLSLKKEEIEELKEQFKIIKRRKFRNIKKISAMPDLNSKDIQEYYSHPEKIPNKFHRLCKAPWVEIDVMPDGTVFTCPDYIMGNIKEESFYKIWNGDNYLKLRSGLKKEGLLPLCRVCASLYEY